MKKFAILREFWQFIKLRKKWWLIPLVLFLVLFGMLLFTAQNSVVAPFIYTLF